MKFFNMTFNYYTKILMFSLTAFFCFAVSATQANAATLTWDGGGGDNNWSTSANWSGDVVPTSADAVIFNATSVKNSVIDTAFTVNSVAVNNGYSGTITQNAALTTTGSFVQNAGTFQGGADSLNFGSFGLSAGAFVSTAGVLNLNNGFFGVGGGTFNHNNGTVSVVSPDINATVTFNNLTFTNTSVLTAGNSIVNGTLTLQNGKLNGGGYIVANGNVVYGAGFTGGDSKIGFQDAATRTVQLTASNGLLGMIINNPNITVRTADTGASTINYTTNLQQGRLEQGSGDLTIIANVTGVSLNQSGGTFAGSAGRLNLNGTTNLTGGNFTGGTGLIAYSSGTPGFSQYGGVFSTAGNVNFYSFYQQGGIFNAPAGTLSLVSQIFLNTGAVFNNNNGTIALNGTGVITAASQAFYNVTVNSGYNSFGNIVNGTLSLVDGTLNGGTAIANGNVTYASTFDGGSSQIQFSDSATRTINLPASNFLLGMIIDNPNITITTSGAGASTIINNTNVKRGVLQQGNAPLNFVNSASGANLTVAGGTFIGGSSPLSSDSLIISGGLFQGGTGLISARINQSGGSFSAGGNLDTASFTLSGGTFNAPSGLMTVVADYNHGAGGTFNAGTGTVKFTGYNTFNCINQLVINVTTETFYNLQLDNSFCNKRYLLGTLIINNNFRLSSGTLIGSRIRPLGTTTIDAGYSGGNGSTVVEYITPNTNFVINNPSSTVTMLPVEMNAANSTLTSNGSGQINFYGMTLLNGTLNQPNAVWDFTAYPGYTQSGGTFNGSAAQLNISTAANGNVLTGGVFNGGTGLINGGYSQSGGTFSTQGDMNAPLFNLSGGIFNAPLGTLSIGAGFTHTAGGIFNARTGTVQTSTDFGTYGISFDVNSTETFNNLKFNGTNNNANHIIAAGDTFIVNGTLTFAGRGVSGGSIVANGAVNYTNYGGYQNGTTLVKFQDAAARTVAFTNDCTSYFQPTLVDNPNITINTGCDTPSAILTWTSLDLRQGTVNAGNSRSSFSGSFTQSGGTFNAGNNTTNPATDFGGNFTLSGGTFNAVPFTSFGANYTHTAGGTFNYGAGTVSFSGFGNNYNATIDVNGTENFNNVTFSVPNSLYGRAVAAGDTITANGNLTITGGGYVNGGTLEAKQDFTISGGFLGGNSNVLFSGTVDQTYTNGNNGSPSGTWTVNKPNSVPLNENVLSPAAATTLTTTGNVGSVASGNYPVFNVVSGKVQKGAGDFALGSLTLAAGTRFDSLSNGTFTFAGAVQNDGILSLNANGTGCQADGILLRSSAAGTQRAWNGSGSFRLLDVDVKDQAGTAPIIAYSSTNSGNNAPNWTFDAACGAPTAASVIIGGRIVGSEGRGVSNAILTLVDSSGQIRFARTNPFGYYRFTNVSSGVTYTITVSHKTRRFTNATRFLNITEDVNNIDFVADNLQP